MPTIPSHTPPSPVRSASAGAPSTSARIMASSLHDDFIRKYFVETQLRPYISGGTLINTEVVSELSKDAHILLIYVHRADGRSITLQGELSWSDAQWPKVSEELIAQLMMVG